MAFIIWHQKKTIKTKNKLSKLLGYKVNIKSSIAILFIANEITMKQIDKVIIITIATKIKYLGKNLTKEVNDLCNESYQTLVKEIDDITNKRLIPCS